jgi:hypothetical protein
VLLLARVTRKDPDLPAYLPVVKDVRTAGTERHSKRCQRLIHHGDFEILRPQMRDLGHAHYYNNETRV